ncbi:MAG: UDP-N-acetylmuramoyl-tripeptide--D-alanyl-D-alanine ligase [Candidatus Jorgensenbacteria bacterium]|nr:UDP-N-acetylmuramoyl-tripeptide--D-alanyl-D-alanine ligase [Candidatus Jorgensenbacteria bacterium]
MKQFTLNVLQFILKFLARLTIARYKPVIVGVTGSVGKTTTREAIRAVISRERTVRAPSKNFNNELGFPLTILGDWSDIGGVFFWIGVIILSVVRVVFKNSDYPEVLVLEYAIDKPGDMKYLLSIARPQIGVLTAVGEVPVHVEFFAGPEAVFREKAKLISQLPSTGFAILNADDKLALTAEAETRAQVIAFGFSDKADVRLSNFTNQLEEGVLFGSSFKFSYRGNMVPVRIKGSLGKAQAYAAAAAAAIGSLFGANLVSVAEALLDRYNPLAGRTRIIAGLKQSIIIDDTYNASPLAMREGLETLRATSGKRRIAVLGDMLELGTFTLEAHEEVGRLAAKCADVLITVGLRGKFISESAIRAGFDKKKVSAFMSVAEAGKFLQTKLAKGDIVLVKGSQGTRMEKIVKEVMMEPEKAEKLLVRQNKIWLAKPGLYE